MKKLVGASSLITFMAALGILGGVAFANAGQKPTIDKIKDRTDDSITLDIIYAKYAKKKVDIKVKVKNKETEKEETRTFTKTLNSNGSIDVKVDELKSDTKYSFKVQIKKHSKDDYGDYSDSTSKSTED